MGKINVTLPDGRVVAVDEADYKASRGEAMAPKAEGAAGTVARTKEQRREELFGGVGGALTAGLVSAADTVSFGTVGKVAQLIDPDAKAAMQGLAETNPVASTVGMVAGSIAPVGMAAGATKAGAAVAGRVGTGVGGRAAGLATEGIVQGVAAEMTAANISTDGMTVEGLASTVTVSAALNVGIGLVAHRLINGGSKATKVMKADDLKIGELDFEPAAVKNKTPLGDLAKARARAEAAVAAEKPLAELESIAAAKAEKARAANALENGTKAARRAATEEAENAFVEATVARQKAMDAQATTRQALTGAKEVLDNSPGYESFRASYESAQKAARANNAKVAAETEAWTAFANEQGITSVLGDYERLAAEARAQVQRGRVAGPTADVKLAKGAQADAKAKVLAIKATGAEGAEGELLAAQAKTQKALGTEAKVTTEMAQADWAPILADLTTINKEVRSALRAGDIDSAIMSMRGANQRLSAIPNFKMKLPDLPQPPSGKPLPEGPKLPKRLLGLGAKNPESIAALANSLDEMSAAELGKLADELGFVPGNNPAETIATLAKALRDDYYQPLKKLARETAPPSPRRGAIAEAAGKVDAPWELVDDLTEAEYKLARAEEAAMTKSFTTPPSSKAEWDLASTTVADQRASAGISEMTLKEGTDLFAEQAVSGGAVAEAVSSAPTGLIDRALLWSRMGAARSAARLADVGGYQGAFLRTIAGSGVGYALDGKRGALEGAIAMNAMGAKVGVRAQVRQALSRFGQGAGLTLKLLGPATGGLANRVMGGRDTESDEAKLALARINEINQAGSMGPDALYHLVKGVMGVSGDLALKLHQQWMGNLKYLGRVAPKDPGIDVTMGGSNWVPSPMKVDAFAHAYEATLNPAGYLARVMSGDGSLAGVDALAQNWPSMLQEAQSEVLARGWENLSAEETRGFSQLFRTPLSGMQHPSVVLAMQSQFIPRAEAGGASGGGAPPNPTGRPPAVQSPVAGANVAGLIS